ncbi:MAG: transcription initiation factor IIB [Nitrosarchaeum sp.]|nr:transcription initiation factor IIB [Nitrosarchaeum sp.]
MVQKMIEDKGDFLLCAQSIVITDFETGELICSKCGKVLQEKTTDTRKEWTSTADHSMPTSMTMHDMGLSTVIGRSNHDFGGKPLGYTMNQSMRRMRLWDSRSQAHIPSDKNLKTALYEMVKLKEKLGLSDAVIGRAAYLYRKASKAHLVRGRTIKSVVGACMYIACRDMETTRTITDIANHLQEKRKTIAKSYRILFQNLMLSVIVADPINDIVKFANNLQLPEITKREAIRIFNILKEKELVAGKNPHAVAAVLYIAGIKTNVPLSQHNITQVSGITSVTIRNRLHDYKKHRVLSEFGL